MLVLVGWGNRGRVLLCIVLGRMNGGVGMVGSRGRGGGGGYG